MLTKKIKDRDGVKINYLAKCLVCGHCFRKSSSGHTPDRLLYLDHRVVDIIMDFSVQMNVVFLTSTVSTSLLSAFYGGCGHDTARIRC